MRVGRRVSASFTTEQVTGPQDRGFGVISGPNHATAWETKGALERDADALLSEKRNRRKRGASPGTNNRTGVINRKTQAVLGHVAWLLGAGYPLRKIQRMTGLCRPTLRTHIKRMGLVPGLCVCGQVGTHQ